MDETDCVKARRAAGKTVVSPALHNPSSSSPKIQVSSREAAMNRPELVIVRA